MIGYIGSYTKENGQGIYRYELDSEKGEFKSVEVAAQTPNATYLDIQNDRIYAIKKGKTKGGVATYEIADLETGELRFIDDCLEEGIGLPLDADFGSEPSGGYRLRIRRGTSLRSR